MLDVQRSAAEEVEPLKMVWEDPMHSRIASWYNRTDPHMAKAPGLVVPDLAGNPHAIPKRVLDLEENSLVFPNRDAAVEEDFPDFPKRV